MNLVEKVQYGWKRKHPLENLLVITDDLNLSFGTIKPKGSDGGHNGLKNINLILNTNQYTRSDLELASSKRKTNRLCPWRLGRSGKLRFQKG
jgi:PTH1 family peptidyl-tRNA hydrolase